MDCSDRHFVLISNEFDRARQATSHYHSLDHATEAQVFVTFLCAGDPSDPFQMMEYRRNVRILGTEQILNTEKSSTFVPQSHHYCTRMVSPLASISSA